MVEDIHRVVYRVQLSRVEIPTLLGWLPGYKCQHWSNCVSEQHSMKRLVLFFQVIPVCQACLNSFAYTLIGRPLLSLQSAKE